MIRTCLLAAIGLRVLILWSACPASAMTSGDFQAAINHSVPADRSEDAAGNGNFCALPPDAGPCDGVCPRYYFDTCTGQCEQFIYGCCGGNANNFETPAACEAACPPRDNICFLPADVGPCDGLCPRYY